MNNKDCQVCLRTFADGMIGAEALDNFFFRVDNKDLPGIAPLDDVFNHRSARFVKVVGTSDDDNPVGI